MSPTRVVIEEVSILTCRAPHPDAARRPRFAKRLHGVQIGPPLPFRCEPTGRTWRATDAIEPREGYIPAQCKCGTVTEYAVIAPADLTTAGLAGI